MQAKGAVGANRARRFSRIANDCFFLALGSGKDKIDHFLARSEKFCSLAVEEDPASPIYRNNRALVRAGRDDFEGAFLDFEAAKRLCRGNEERIAVVERNSQTACDRIGAERRKHLLKSIPIGI